MKAPARTWAGAWRATETGAAVWRFEAEPPSGLEVHALGVKRRAAELTPHLTEQLSIEWREDSVEIIRHGRLRTERFTAREVLVHEPMPAVYAQLPLEQLDRRARRFWSRVFWLVRLPGGRSLLRWLARRR